MAFYACRGYTLETLANLSYVDKIFLHHAREKYYEDECEKYLMILKMIFGEKR